ncbi:MAG: GGDEF domain-containing protein [Acidiferrobacterales bacterium]
MSEFDKTIIEDGTPMPADASQKPCLTVLYGGPVGLVYTLPVGSETLIGRGDEADLPLGEARVSRSHAVIRVNPDNTVVIEDLGSSNGTFVNGTKVDKRQLEDGDRVQIGYSCIIKFSYQDALEYQLQHEIAGGVKDPLTGLYTKMYFDDRLASEFTHACRRKDNLGVLLVAIDHFDKVNLCHGQSAGEVVVKEVARAVNSVLRAGDVFACYDAVRFALLARDLDEKGSAILRQRIRKVVQGTQCDFNGTSISLTVSVGVATLADQPEDAGHLIKLADASLRQTRLEGNQGGADGSTTKTHVSPDEAVTTVYYVPGQKA